MNKFFKEANKIWPAKSAIPIIISFFVLSTLIMVVTYFVEIEVIKNDYNSFRINGRIEKIIRTNNYVFCKINSDWYGIRGDINIYISQNDILQKKTDSYKLTVTKENGKTNVYDFPNTYFCLVRENKKLIKYFKSSKLIPDSIRTSLKKCNKK